MTTTTWREELSWAAGFFDGEGWTGSPQRPRAPRSDHRARIHITQAYNRHVLDRFQEAVGVGKIHGPYPQPRGGDKWTYIATDLQHVQAIIAMMWTFLSPVKRAQAKAALAQVVEDARNGPGRGLAKKTCKHGHDLTHLRVRTQGGRRVRVCLPCGAAKIRRRRAELRLAACLLVAI